MARLTDMNLRIFEPSAMFGQLAICLLVLWSILGAAQDQSTAPTDQGRPLPPRKPFITMSEKVADANHIFVGSGTRIYFIDKHAREVPFGSSESERGGGIKNAILEIKIERTLYFKDFVPEKTALVPLLVRLEPVYPATKSTYEIAAMKYLDKR